MSKQHDTVQAQVNPDSYKDEVLQRPGYHHHSESINTKHFVPHFISTVQHMMNDHHNPAKQFCTSVVKGAFVGFCVGTTMLSLNRNSAMFWKKVKLFADVSRANEAKMFWQVNKNTMVLGGMIGGSFQVFWSTLRHGKTENLQWDMIWMSAVFSSVWTVALVHPKYWWAGALTGGLLGFTVFQTIYNGNTAKGTEGYATKFDNGLTEQERSPFYLDKNNNIRIKYTNSDLILKSCTTETTREFEIYHDLQFIY